MPLKIEQIRLPETCLLFQSSENGFICLNDYVLCLSNSMLHLMNNLNIKMYMYSTLNLNDRIEFTHDRK